MKTQRPAAQRGVFVILFAVMLAMILALAGLAIDIGFVYEREGDMKNVANAAALAAAHQLDGTADGIDNALDAAEDAVLSNSWGNEQRPDWAESALSFGASPEGPWRDAGSVLALPAAQIQLYRYARVDAGQLDDVMNVVTRYFPFGGETDVRLESMVSVAGPVMTQMLPLGVCAMDANRHSSRAVDGMTVFELVEHGFRRGVTYNLLRLNPAAGSTTPASFLINPVDFPDTGSGSDTANFMHGAVAPFMCAGSIAQPASDRVYVQQPFPTSLIPELNSRFGVASSCVASAALPDRNIKNFLTADWLNNNARTIPHAQERITAAGMMTVADLPPSTPAGRLKEHYGTVWAYVRPVRYSATAASHAGSAFRAADIDNLYPVDAGDKVVTTWPDTRTLLAYNFTFETPAGAYLRYRRILHVPLLACPVTSDTATVLAVAKFMLTAPASDDPSAPYIPAEFGGLLPGHGSATDTRLYQ